MLVVGPGVATPVWNRKPLRGMGLEHARAGAADESAARPIACMRARSYTWGMTTVDEIRAAIEHLPKDKLSELRDWFAEFDAAEWDRQFEESGNDRLRHMHPQ